MRLFALVFFFFLVFGSQQPHNKAQQSTATDQRGTQDAPLIVKVIPTPKTPEETAHDTADRKQKTDNDGNLVKLTGVLAIVGFLQLIVFGVQAYQLQRTVNSSGEQSAAMDRHIGEVARSASAMEKVVTTIEAGNKAILRAYLTVTIGPISLFQERREPGQADLKFETRPNLNNTGNTPARNVTIRIAADILPIPIPDEFQFPLPEEGEIKNAGVVGAHQTTIVAGTVKDFVPDEEIGRIKEGRTKALCVWGLITYDDIFGMNHWTSSANGSRGTLTASWLVTTLQGKTIPTSPVTTIICPQKRAACGAIQEVAEKVPTLRTARPQGLKPKSIPHDLRGAKAPLFHEDLGLWPFFRTVSSRALPQNHSRMAMAAQ